MLQGRVEIVRGIHSAALDKDNRKVRVYLPPDYDSGMQRYPAVYLHDAQWCFMCEGQDRLPSAPYPDDQGVDVTVDGMIAKGEIPPIILVGIDCDENDRRREMSHSTPPGARRMGRRGYIPCYSFEGEGLGLRYQSFIVDEVKPLIDRMYRTLPGREHTLLTGSSMGGLVSLRMGMYRCDVFGMLGLQSPAVHWESDGFYNETVRNHGQKIWLDCGSAESYYVDNTRCLAKILLSLGYEYGKDLAYYAEPGAIHEPMFFVPRMRQMLKWFFSEKTEPVKCEIGGLPEAAVAGHRSVLNTMVTYANGVTLTDLDAEYDVDPKDVLSVSRTGEIDAKRAGIAQIRYKKNGLCAEKTVTVFNSLSESVLMHITAKVPEDTPADDLVVFHFFRDQYLVLDKYSDGLYRGYIGIPRGWEFDGHFTRCIENRDRKRECTRGGDRVDRRVIADQELHLEYTVERWLE